jgi:hypothetical protein
MAPAKTHPLGGDPAACDVQSSLATEATSGLCADTAETSIPAQIEMVVDLLEAVYQANGRMAAELDRLAASRTSVSDAAVHTLVRLAEDLRPGAAARARLAELDHDLQVAGAAAWIARRRQLDCDVELIPTARVRAHRRWGRRPGGAA